MQFLLNHRNLCAVTSGRMRGFLEDSGCYLQIIDEALVLACLGFLVR